MPKQPHRARRPDLRTLTVDIGGSGLKAVVLDGEGQPIGDRVRVPTPVGRPPKVVLRAICDLVGPLGAFDRVSVGFPGVVRGGVVRTAPNMGHAKWQGFDLARALADELKVPVRVLNDSEVQGMAVIEGTGVELVITLGTGMGSALFLDGKLTPHLELSQHPIRGNKTYDQYLGEEARKRVGTRKWNRRVRRALTVLDTVVNYDRLHIGGGNATRIDFDLGPRARTVDNSAGLRGGIALWE